MEEKQIKGFNINLLKDNFKIISSEEALKDVIQIQWSNEVLSGKNKIIISR